MKGHCQVIARDQRRVMRYVCEPLHGSLIMKSDNALFQTSSRRKGLGSKKEMPRVRQNSRTWINKSVTDLTPNFADDDKELDKSQLPQRFLLSKSRKLVHNKVTSPHDHVRLSARRSSVMLRH